MKNEELFIQLQRQQIKGLRAIGFGVVAVAFGIGTLAAPAIMEILTIRSADARTISLGFAAISAVLACIATISVFNLSPAPYFPKLKEEPAE
jgi:hypothetical protein